MDDFRRWIKSLHEPLRSKYDEEGLSIHKNNPYFQKFMLDHDVLGIDVYMKEKLLDSDYRMWKGENEETFV